MPILIKSVYHKLFPARQLLIRQNGEVKHIVLAPWLQAFAVLCAFVALTWLTLSTVQVYSQTNKISDIQQSQLTKQQKWQKQQHTQQTKHDKQAEQLASLEQKQALLQSMIESLPESMSNPQSSPALELDESQSNSEFHEPLVDAQQNDTTFVPKKSSSLEPRLVTLNKQYDHSFKLLESRIEQRQQHILTMLKGAGLEKALTNHLNKNSTDTAQGGPLNLFNESKIPSKFLAIADKLLSLNNLENLLSQLPQSLPAEEYYISSGYGLRKDPMNRRHAFHKGVDLAGRYRSKIFSPADGTVLRAGRNGGYGNFIELQHKNGLVTRFGHLNKIKVTKGQIVKKDDVIGLMGSTGRSTGTHLHYEVLLNGQHVNPVKITKALSHVR